MVAGTSWNEGQEDRDYWNDKYEDPMECDIHGEMWWDSISAEWFCSECDQLGVIYNYG